MLNFNRGGMLTGREILKQVKKGNIHIDPFDESQLNPNSYNLRLGKELAIYSRGSTDRVYDLQNLSKSNPHVITGITETDPGFYSMDVKADNDNNYIMECPLMYNSVLDPISMNKDNELIRFEIPETGYVLQPGVLYLGRTVEHTYTDKYIPMINGRSSGGRLGISIHICAGFGDIGFDGTWTLEITAVEPVIIFPNTEIAQVCYFTPVGNTKMQYNGRYNKQVAATGSRFYKSKQEVYE